MDRNAFDGLTKLLASSPNRRAALGALLGAGLAGLLGADAAKKHRGKKRRAGRTSPPGADVAAQAADCANPGPSSNISGCGYQNDDFSGDDLSGSKMVGTNFRNAELAGANLSSSNARNAIFREANLACANLRSATLGGADFRAADLTLATLKSSGGCNSAQFNAATMFCRTVMCDGSVRNDDCAGGAQSCCTDAECGPNETCQGNECRCGGGPGCADGQVCYASARTPATCATPCEVQEDCPGCVACTSVAGGRFCRGPFTGQTCNGSTPCPAGQLAVVSGTGICDCVEVCAPS